MKKKQYLTLFFMILDVFTSLLTHTLSLSIDRLKFNLSFKTVLSVFILET